jgi:PAS domain S-box-containing protein
MDFLASLPFDRFPDMAMILSGTGIVQKTNEAFAKSLEHDAGAINGQPFTEAIHQHDKQPFDEFISKVKSNGTGSGLLTRMTRKNGSGCQVNWSGLYLPQEDLIFCTGREMPESPEEAQRMQSEHLFEALVENAFDLLAVTNDQGIWTYVSASLAAVIGSSREELIGQYCFEYIHPDDLPQLGAQMQLLLQGQRKIQGPPYRFRNAAGQWMWMEAIVTNQLDNPDIRGIIITGRDISDRILAEKNAREMQLLEALQEGEEKERNRIARDLHDGVSGMIAAAKMHVTTLAEKVPAVKVNPEYQLSIGLLDDTAVQVRRTSHNLMPEILLENGLDQALERYCNSIGNTQLKLDYILMGDVQRYSAKFELSLYRIVQELVSNIIRHANATEALVQVSYQAGQLSLTVEDNGIGFQGPTRTNGMGLRSIERRVAAMNGAIEIQSAPGRGTSLYLSFQTVDPLAAGNSGHFLFGNTGAGSANTTSLHTVQSATGKN